ncbi:putative late blight resistance protein homolog R1A-4 [Ipomoea triloba]|uniref:putative late blight resistance protein homolog R1A-4 n=1 Tax=Ipomoea triloba TaxID=35885 RepID=UPI00125D9FAB|nr:putative late blight resistance protein homolog R1A-4 [Ipomoea triloba]
MAVCVAVLSLMRTLELEFLQPLPRPILQEMELISCNKEFIQSLHQKLGDLIELLNESRIDCVEAIKELETKLRDVAFRVEDEIEFQIAHLHKTEEEFEIGTPQGDTDAQSPFKLGLILQQGIEDIDAVKEELVNINNTLDVLPISAAEPASEFDNEMIFIDDDFDDDFESIQMILIPTLFIRRCNIVAISGVGGIGKTTLARRIYEDPKIASHFYKRAWVVASKYHNERQMLLGILNSIGYANSSTHYDDLERLEIKLYEWFKCERCLIVIDDVWSVEACDAIRRCFPEDEDENDSRVLLTTRLPETYFSSNSVFFNQMHPLHPSDSWDIFCLKAGTSHCANFETIARPIVEKCRGLPLAVVTVASVVSNLNVDPGEWENIAMTNIVEVCSTIISLDYSRLPYNLKACFLYLGIFPEGKVIYVKDLVRLWASEGLIKEFANQSLDEVAERCLQDLLDRNLILESKRSYCGRKIRAFKLNDLVHAFCVREAQKEKLLHVVPGNGFQKGSRWLSIQSTDFDDDARTLLHSCRSIFCFSEVKSLHLKSFNLLRVFYFTDASMCKKIVDLVHLRYLPQVVRDFRMIKLLKAWNLQTLDVYADEKLKKFGQQQYSQSPSKLELKPCDCTIELFLRSPHLKEVVITGERRNCNDCIDTLVFLGQLRRLYINGSVCDYRTPPRISINNQIAGLKSLVELSFRSMNFEWNGINVLCQLPRLKVLRLLSSSIGKEWEFDYDHVFYSLVYFEIFSTDLKYWEARDIHFPKLERLLLRDCFRLRELPCGFDGIKTLKSIELTRCIPSAVNSAKQIQEMQHKCGNKDLVLIEKETIIQPSSDEDVSTEDESDEDEAEES